MNYRHYHQRDPIKNYFPLPNEIFSLEDGFQLLKNKIVVRVIR